MHRVGVEGIIKLLKRMVGLTELESVTSTVSR